MSKMYNLIQILLENSKYQKGIEKMEKIKEEISLKEYSMDTLMKCLNSNDLKPYVYFEISGYLSSSACLEIPLTYHPEKRSILGIKQIYENGKIINEFQMEVSKNNLPLCIPKKQDESRMGFLYLDCNNRYEIDRDSSFKPIITEKQKFIPVLLGNENYYYCIDSEVKLKCFVLPLDDILDNQISLIDEEEYKSVMSYFYNLYASKVNLYVLICNEIISTVKKNKVNEIVNFIVEYEILGNVSSREITESLGKFHHERYRDIQLTSFKVKNDNKRTIFLSRNGIFISVNKRNVGFSMDIDLNDNEKYMNKIKELESYISGIFYKLKWQTELTFISDFRKEKIFNQDFRYKK